ncbi:serine/threonine protein kinase [Nannizzia gypsea CBS 118893]|uniref:Serine/threonine protein kinase n=1 Tax=Arthroderma gypseum (strain ATCC MYA-4604 / CBS 118893) TaxID=535722 RepID=E4UYZ3_ARTGP|nr:serine/threonine protein kinase [Nannizzia gypsea CBS 118893]EFR03323.1 serine/threonine protein kinase [Nannizzia gypsea CBS 118893]
MPEDISIDVDVHIQAFITDLSIAHSDLEIWSVLSPNAPNNASEVAITTEFALLLQRFNVPRCYDVGIRSFIASGAQFTVNKEVVTFEATLGEQHDVVSKVPKFFLDPNEKLSLSNTAVRRHVRDLITELSVLCHPKLRNHPNIVHLMGWGLDTSIWHQPPFLALEAADGDLESILRTQPDLSMTDRQSILLDVANGLDAMHEVGFVHGDLKPSNILIFYPGGKCRGKLADFGGGGDLSQDEIIRGRGTVGWRAPELRRFHDHGEALDRAFVSAVDVYSYGLLIWSLLCNLPGPPSGGESHDAVSVALANFEECHQVIPESLLHKTKHVILKLLDQDPTRRVTTLQGWMGDGDSEEVDISDLDFDQYVELGPEFFSRRFDWEFPDIKPFLSDPDLLTPELAFAAFLSHEEFRLGRFGEISRAVHDPQQKDKILALLDRAAREGVQPAQAIIFRIHEYFQKKIDPDLECNRRKWLSDSIHTGALFLTSEVQAIDPVLFNTSVRSFRESGGYNSYYSQLDPDTLAKQVEGYRTSGISPYKPLNPRGDCIIHVLASSASPKATLALKDILTPGYVNISNNLRETPLYRACLCGSSETVLFLLSLGADASIHPDSDGPTCLHWLSVFEPLDIPKIAEGLISRGANINSLCTQRIKMFHYPFVLPVGTPLHWAVQFSCAEAVKTLLANGASPYVRDRLRPLPGRNRNDDNEDDTNEPITNHTGASSIDIAVWDWNHAILDLLLASQSSVRVNDTDDRGYGPMHKLHVKEWYRISETTYFNDRFMRGTHAAQMKSIRETIGVLLSHGFDINRLSAPGSSSRICCSPLIFAIRGCDIDVVQCLLDERADIEVPDSEGRTPIMSIGEVYISQDRLRVLGLLLPLKPCINVRDKHGDTAVIHAAGLGQVDLVDTLLDHGANALDRIEHPGGKPANAHKLPDYCRTVFALLASPWMHEMDTVDRKIAAMLRKHILPLLRTGIAKEARNIPLAGHAIDRADLAGGTLLHYMAGGGLFESCTVLLMAGADVNAIRIIKNVSDNGQNNSRQTPLDKIAESTGNLKKYSAQFYSKPGKFNIKLPMHGT